jgi:hypothetical protein
MGYFFSSLSKSETSTALDTSEWGLLIFGLILTIGALGEYKMLPRLALKFVPHKVFEFIVAVGIAGEFIADGGVFLFSRHLQTISDGEYAALNKKLCAALPSEPIAILSPSFDWEAYQYAREFGEAGRRCRESTGKEGFACCANAPLVSGGSIVSGIWIAHGSEQLARILGMHGIKVTGITLSTGPGRMYVVPRAPPDEKPLKSGTPMSTP